MDNPNIKATLEPFAGGDSEYGPKALALHAAGTIGDCMWTSIGSVLHYFLASKRVIAPLEELVQAADYDLSVFFPSAVESCKLEGKLVGLPLKAHPGGAFIFYNKTMFQDEGVPEPQEGWTVDDMLEAAVALTKPGQWGLKLYTGRLNVMLARTFGGDFIDVTGTQALINKEETKDALRYQYDLYHEYEVHPMAQAMTGTNEFQLMATGKMAMFQAGPWGGTIVNRLIQQGEAEAPARFEWWLVPLALGPANVVGSHAEVDCVAVTSQSKHKEEAFKLCSYFTDYQSGIHLCLGDAVCGAREDLADDPQINGTHHTANDTEMFRIIREVTANALPYYYPANFRGQEAFQYYQQGLDPLWLGDEEPTDAFFDEANKGLQAILDKPPA
jgi:ABC-type glycerol-3-phosphate transport system substrate-binding protein